MYDVLRCALFIAKSAGLQNSGRMQARVWSSTSDLCQIKHLVLQCSDQVLSKSIFYWKSEGIKGFRVDIVRFKNLSFFTHLAYTRCTRLSDMRSASVNNGKQIRVYVDSFGEAS